MSTATGRRRWVLIGSYGPPDAASIHVCTLDELSGDLRVLSSVSGVANPSFLAVSPCGRVVYAVSETAVGSDGTPGGVHAFELTVGRQTLDLTPLNHRSSGGDHPCHLRIGAGGRWLAVSNYGTGSVAVLPIGTDGSLGEIASLVANEGTGPHSGRQNGPHVHAAAFMPGDQFLVAVDLGIDRLVVHAFDSRTGSLTPHSETSTRPGAGPRHLAVHPDREHLFVVNELDNTITRYRWDPDAGELKGLDTLSTLPSDASASIASDVAVAADGRHVYVANRGHDSVAVFAFERGRMSLVALRPSGGAWPRSIGLTAGDVFLLTANQHDDHVAVLPISSGGAEVGDPVAGARIPRPTCIAFVDRV